MNTNKFKISMPLLEKSYDRVEDGVRKFFIGGLASATNLDLEEERMASSAILAFQRSVNDGLMLPDGRWTQVPLRSGHRGEWDDVLGWIVNCSITENWEFMIEAELDPLNPNAMSLWNKLQRGDQPGRPLELGFSVGGYVLAAGEEWEPELARYIKVYYDVALQEVSVVGKPANPLAYVQALSKSVDWSKVKGRTVLMTEEELMTKNAELAIEKSKSEEVVAASAEAAVEEAVERSAEEVVEESEQVEKTDAAEGETAEEVVERSAEVAAEGESNVEEEVAKSESDASTDPLDELKGQVAELAKGFESIATLVELVKSLVPSAEAEVEEEVAKSTEEEQVVETDAPVEEVERSAEAEVAESVEKAATTDFAALIKSAVSEATSGLQAEIQTLRKHIEVLESQEVDKSISVSVHGEEDPIAKLELMKSEGLTGKDYFHAAMKVARGEDPTAA